VAVSTDVKISTLSYVILYVKDTTKSVPFYRDTLGLKVRVDEHGWVEFESGAVTLALHGHENMPAKRQDGEPIVVFNVENIQQAYEALKAKGVKFEKEPHQVCEGAEGKVGKSADFVDLDGNRLSIFGYEKK
jgi:catechol 2,3-dioxygenase-like lactoylglutathione lyase family enzyme